MSERSDCFYIQQFRYRSESAELVYIEARVNLPDKNRVYCYVFEGTSKWSQVLINQGNVIKKWCFRFFLSLKHMLTWCHSDGKWCG